MVATSRRLSIEGGRPSIERGKPFAEGGRPFAEGGRPFVEGREKAVRRERPYVERGCLSGCLSREEAVH
jgi:hypothetical protein